MATHQLRRRTAAAAAVVGAATLSLAPVQQSAAAAAVVTVRGAVAAPHVGWGLDRIDQRRLPLNHHYRPRGTGAGVTIYLIDTGIDVSNPEFGGRASLSKTYFGRSRGDCADELGVGHGTFVAGIAAGKRTGAAPAARLVELKAVACGEGAHPVSPERQRRLVVRATDWIRHHGVRPAVVNMSLAFDQPAPTVDAAVRRLIRSGITVVAAAGNDDENACGFSPARVPSVLTVAASDRYDRSWREPGFGGTNWGPCVDLYAPGKNITSALLGGGIYRDAGVGATSWATPFVTGVVALYLQRHPHASPNTVARWVLGNATKGVITHVPDGTPNRLLYSGRR